MDRKFKEGDVIISNRGTKPLEVCYVPNSSWDNWGLKYLHNGKINYVSNDCVNDNYLFYDTDEPMKTEMLYSFDLNGATSFGTHIGTNSNNQYIIEEKGTGAIHILDKDKLEEVLPYTFSATLSGNVQHYIASPGSVKVGDVLLCTAGNSPTVAVVKAVDTKNKEARKFKGAKIVTETI
jgi:polynucleotide 5'-kinase involved in rRNA processing